MTVENTSLKNRVALELKLSQAPTKESLSILFDFFDGLQIDTFFIKLYPDSFKIFNEFIEQKSKPLKLLYAHTPIIHNIILKDLHKTQQIFQPHLFCRKNYFKQHKSWGYPIFYFIDNEPEIYHFGKDTDKIHQPLDYPEDISAIMLLKAEDDNSYSTKDVIRFLKRDPGFLDITVKKGFEYTMVIMRKLYLYYDNGLKYKVNIHDDYLLKKQSEIFLEQINTDKFNGSYMEANAFFAKNGFVTSGPEITRNYNRISDNKFKADLALFWNKYGNNNELQNVNIQRMINTYIDGILLPKFSYIHKKTILKAEIDNPYFINNLAALKTVYKIDEDKFLFHEEYYLSAIVNLKRALNYRSAHNVSGLKIFFDQLLNIKHNFEEKKVCIDILLANGADQIFFKYNADIAAETFIQENILSDLKLQKVYGLWFNYINRLAHTLASGKPVAKLLMIYPALDNDIDAFRKAVKELEKTCLDYDIMDYQTFINDSKCQVQNGKIVFGDYTYHTVILSGISKIPLKVLKKIDEFVVEGGVAIGLKQLPKEIEKQENEENLRKLLKKTWIEESELKSTNYKANDKGGVGYFQEDISLLPNVLSEQNIRFKYPIFSEQEFIKIYTRDLTDHLIILAINHADKYIENALLTCQTQGPVFKIAFDDGLLYAQKNVSHSEKTTAINLSLDKHESVLLKVMKQAEAFPDTIEDHTKINNTAEYIELGPYDWFISNDEFEDTTQLGDRSKAAPYEWRTITYSKIIHLETTQLENKRVFLMLNELYDWCTLYVNDKKVGSRLYPPWEFEITSFLVSGTNGLSIEIGHRLSNHLAIEVDDEKHIAPVMQYGLIGPVNIRLEENI